MSNLSDDLLEYLIHHPEDGNPGLIQNFLRELKERRASASASECEWRLAKDYDDDVFDTDCGEKFIIIEGTPKHNKMKFCCYCGKKLACGKGEHEE